jgi:hypothetical protein
MGGVVHNVLSKEDGTRWIRSRGTPFAVGKLGIAECNVLIFYILFRRGNIKLPYPKDADIVSIGLTTDDAVDVWSESMLLSVLPSMDGMALWNPCSPLHELNILQTYAPRATLFPIESYYELTAEEQNRYPLVDLSPTP